MSKIFIRFIVVLVLALMSSTLVWAGKTGGGPAPGSLDTTFDLDGKVTTDFANNYDQARAVAIQANGKILVAGGIVSAALPFDFGLARYNADGSLDNSFGLGGKVYTDFANADDQIFALKVLSDGTILAAGYSGSDFALAKYTSAGALVSSFGSQGKVTTSVSANIDVIYGIAIQPADQKIVVVGTTLNQIIGTCGGFSTCYYDYRMVVARYNSDGTLDTHFGNQGIVITDFDTSVSEEAHAVGIQYDGTTTKIVVAGLVNNDQTFTTVPKFALARYNENGTLDSTFGSGGKVTTDLGGAKAYAMTLDGAGFSGKIILAGSAAGKFAVARYSGANGTLDGSFGTGGVVTTDIAPDTYLTDVAYGVALQGTNIVAVGSTDAVQCDRRGSNCVPAPFAIVRYTNAGVLDTSFGTGGKVTVSLSAQSGGYTGAYGVGIQADNKIVAAGTIYKSTSGFDFGVVRLNP